MDGLNKRSGRLPWMLATVSRDDAARLLLESVRDALGRRGFVVATVCDAAEQCLRALTIEEADAITIAIDAHAERGHDALGEQSDQDRWLRLRRQLLDRTITGAPETVPIVERDLAVLCACFERGSRTLEAAAHADAEAVLDRVSQSLSPEDRIVFADDEVEVLLSD